MQPGREYRVLAIARTTFRPCHGALTLFDTKVRSRPGLARPSPTGPSRPGPARHPLPLVTSFTLFETKAHLTARPDPARPDRPDRPDLARPTRPARTDRPNRPGPTSTCRISAAVRSATAHAGGGRSSKAVLALCSCAACCAVCCLLLLLPPCCHQATLHTRTALSCFV